MNQLTGKTGVSIKRQQKVSCKKTEPANCEKGSQVYWLQSMD